MDTVTSSFPPTLPTGSKTQPFKLETLDRSKVVEFLITPSEQAYTFNAEYSKIPVLGREQPFINYRHSEHQVSLPDIKFWVYGNMKDISAHLKDIANFTKPLKETLEPPVLRLSMGTVVYERIRVTKFQYKVDLMMGGTPTSATGSLDFIIDPIPPEPTLAPATTVLSEAERAKAVTDITKLLDTDKAKAKLYSYEKGKTPVTVSNDGDVKVKDSVIGKLADILGTATPPALNSPDMKKAQPTKPDKPKVKPAPKTEATGMM
jgi:hypothetical protein